MESPKWASPLTLQMATVLSPAVTAVTPLLKAKVLLKPKMPNLAGVAKVANQVDQVDLNQVTTKVVDGLANQVQVRNQQEQKLVNEFALDGPLEKLADKNAALQDTLEVMHGAIKQAFVWHNTNG